MDESQPSSGDTVVLHVDDDPEALARLARTVDAARPTRAYDAMPADRLAEAGAAGEVVLTVRPHTTGLPRVWAAAVASGSDVPFGQWLEEAASNDDHDYWRRHGHADLARRCVEVAGVDHVTVVLCDDPDASRPVLERALGLRSGSLAAAPAPRTLRAGEVEMLRSFAAQTSGRFRAERVAPYLADSLVPALRGTEPDEADPAVVLPTRLPASLLDAIERDAASLTDLGVRVIDLAETQDPVPRADPCRALVPPRQVAAGVTAMIDRAREEVDAAAHRTPAEIAAEMRSKPVGRRPVVYLSAGQIAGVLAGRAGRRVRSLVPGRARSAPEDADD